MHLGRTVLLRRYVPAVLTSALIVIPYGVALDLRLIQAGPVDLPGLLIYALLAVILTIPFILVMHWVGDALYRVTVRLLIG